MRNLQPTTKNSLTRHHYRCYDPNMLLGPLLSHINGGGYGKESELM